MAELRVFQPSFTAGVLSPSLAARVDLAKYGTGLRTARNMIIHPHGGVSNRAGLEFITGVKNTVNDTRLIPFQFNTEQAYMLEFGHEVMRVIRDGGLVLSGGVPYELVTPYGYSHTARIVFVQEADVMYLTHPEYPVYKLSRLADDNWTITAVTFAPKIAAPSAIGIAKPGDTSGDPDYTPTAYSYKVSAVDDETGEESLPSIAGTVTNDLSIVGGSNEITWTSVAGASRYIIYKYTLSSGAYGYIGGTYSASFLDENITPDTADGPQTARNPFGGPDSYPRCVTFAEQRLAFGSTEDDPQAIFLSQSASYENMGYSSPAKASDAVTFRIKSREVNEIRAMLPIKGGIMVMTSGAEFVVSGGSNSDAITPSAIKIDPQGNRGCGIVQPIQVGNMVLFAQNRGGVIRDFGYQFTEDSFVDRDLTIMAKHLFKGRSIKSWAFSQSPDSIVWVILDNGQLVSLTYMKEHDVWGWTHHDSVGATFESVAVIPEGNEDVPYFVVIRTIGGTSYRYIERMRSRNFLTIQDAFFVDSGLTYSGAAATVISGLDHLEGEIVVALADGNVVTDLTVTAGAITLPNAATKVHVGLGYDAAIQTLKLDVGTVQGLGTIQGRMKTIGKVTLRVENSRGVFTGLVDGTRDQMEEHKDRTAAMGASAIAPYTDDIEVTPAWEWNNHGSLWVKQFYPLPMTILGIMPDVAFGR